jgi:hypothetical protein
MALSQTPAAIRQRRHRAKVKAATEAAQQGKPLSLMTRSEKIRATKERLRLAVEELARTGRLPY